MHKSSGSDMIQRRRSPRGPSSQLRTSSSDSDPPAVVQHHHHHRPRTGRSPKVGADHRPSPKGTQIEPINQKKLGTRIADLESQLGQAQEELKYLKNQLTSAEADKKAAQEQLEKKSKNKPNSAAPEHDPIHQIQGNHSSSKTQDLKKFEEEENQKETDVFEVPLEIMKATAESEPGLLLDHQAAANEEEEEEVGGCEFKTKLMNPPKMGPFEELTMKMNEIDSMKARLKEKEKELEVLSQNNERISTQLNDKSSEVSATKSKLEEMNSKMNQVIKELEDSKRNTIQINEKLQVSEKDKEELEAEIKKMRVQTEQWRKAADAAAAVLAGGDMEVVGMNGGGRISERCGSMDKHFVGSVLQTTTTPRGGGGYLGSPGLPEDSADDDDVYHATTKRKSAGIRMFGDIWKKKGQR